MRLVHHVILLRHLLKPVTDERSRRASETHLRFELEPLRPHLPFVDE